jgi:hypothetical protein
VIAWQLPMKQDQKNTFSNHLDYKLIDQWPPELTSDGVPIVKSNWHLGRFCFSVSSDYSLLIYVRFSEHKPALIAFIEKALA